MSLVHNGLNRIYSPIGLSILVKFYRKRTQTKKQLHCCLLSSSAETVDFCWSLEYIHHSPFILITLDHRPWILRLIQNNIICCPLIRQRR
jgi:hypothetical protein